MNEKLEELVSLKERSKQDPNLYAKGIEIISKDIGIINNKLLILSTERGLSNKSDPLKEQLLVKLEELLLLEEKSKQDPNSYLEEIQETCTEIGTINTQLAIQSIGDQSSIEHHSDVNQ